MAFHENRYLSWYVPKMFLHHDALNLHSSGVTELDPAAYLPVQGNPWEMAARFEAGLATWLGLVPEEVVFSPGATGGTLLSLLSMAEDGKEILVESPIYEPMLRQASRLARVRRLKRRFKDGFRFRLDEARRLVTKRTAAVMITEPCNPAAIASPRDEVLELARLAAAEGACLLVNEVYRRFTDRSSYHGAAENIVVVGSLSKLFGAYWARLGWLSAEPMLAERIRQSHRNLGLPTAPAAAIGISILLKAGELEAQARAAASRGLPIVKEWVEKTRGLSWVEPLSVGFGCIKLPSGVDDLALGEHLLKVHDTLLVPGTMFELPGTVRLSWLQAGSCLEEALSNVRQSIKEIRQKGTP